MSLVSVLGAGEMEFGVVGVVILAVGGAWQLCRAFRPR
jgi:hypothetical protein